MKKYTKIITSMAITGTLVLSACAETDSESFRHTEIITNRHAETVTNNESFRHIETVTNTEADTYGTFYYIFYRHEDLFEQFPELRRMKKRNFGGTGIATNFDINEDGHLITTSNYFVIGTISEIQPVTSWNGSDIVVNDGEYFVIFKDENEFIEFIVLINKNSVLLLDSQLVSSLEIGMEVAGFYTVINNDRRFTLQRNITRSVLSSGHKNISLNRFDENFLSDSSDRQFYISFDDDTEIIFQDGTTFEYEHNELIGRDLIIMSDYVELVYPPITIYPYKIIVLST